MVFIHPGSGGSASAPEPADYAELVGAMCRNDAQYVITAGPGEETLAEELTALLPNVSRATYRSTAGLAAFAERLQFADLFVSSSTGPAHIAGALGRPTATFYPAKVTAGPLRWQTLAPDHRRWAFTPPRDADPLDLPAIDYRRVGGGAGSAPDPSTHGRLQQRDAA